MARIRHVAIRTTNVERLVNFYMTAFGLEVVEGDGTATYLTDGYLNLAIIPERNQSNEGIRSFHQFRSPGMLEVRMLTSCIWLHPSHVRLTYAALPLNRSIIAHPYLSPERIRSAVAWGWAVTSLWQC